MSKRIHCILIVLGFTSTMILFVKLNSDQNLEYTKCIIMDGNKTVDHIRKINISKQVKNSKEFIVLYERNYRFKEWEQERNDAVRPFMRNNTAPDDPALIKVIQRYFLDPPSHKLAKMSNPLAKTGQAEVVDKILNNKENGFFVECGALDGERSSNSIYFEQKRHWTGLLIEMDPSYYLQVMGKNRKSFSINACLSPYVYPTQVDFQEYVDGRGQVLLDNKKGHTFIIHPVYCFPFYSLMLAMNVSHIDYFSLDVEGLELQVLKSIPFDKLNISVFTVEFLHGASGGNSYIDFMKSKGYRLHSTLTECKHFCHDYVFVKN